MVLNREEAITGWRALMGPVNPDEAKEQDPNSLRAKFGQSILDNALHGCSAPPQVDKEIALVFGEVEFDDDCNVKGEGGQPTGDGTGDEGTTPTAGGEEDQT